MTAIKWIGVGVVVLAVLTAGLLLYGQARWSRLTAQLMSRLEAAREAPRPARYDAARELDGLPPPVQRFFRTVLRDGAPMIAAVTVQHSGMFNTSDSGGEQWKPFTSTQRVITRRPGFVWDGRVQMLPGLNVHVHDAYVAGEGLLHPAIAGLFTLADLRDRGGDVAQGELMRFFAEAAWYPTALLPSQGVRWQAVDDTSARATMTDGPLTLTFRFAADGNVTSVRAEARGRTVQGKLIPTPWEGVWSDHAERDGMRVPLTGEVTWLTPKGRKPYWRGTITALAYEFTPR
jgi:hypothetical protein